MVMMHLCLVLCHHQHKHFPIYNFKIQLMFQSSPFFALTIYRMNMVTSSCEKCDDKASRMPI